jgi:hypothetical protein
MLRLPGSRLLRRTSSIVQLAGTATEQLMAELAHVCARRGEQRMRSALYVSSATTQLHRCAAVAASLNYTRPVVSVSV